MKRLILSTVLPTLGGAIAGLLIGHLGDTTANMRAQAGFYLGPFRWGVYNIFIEVKRVEENEQ